MKTRLYLALSFGLFAAFLSLGKCYSQVISTDRQYIDRVFLSSNGQSLPYKVLFPEGFDPSKKYPLFLFLHGAGERGTDNKRQVLHGDKYFRSDTLLKDVILIAPQCPWEDYWVCIIKPEDPVQRVFPANAPISSSALAVKELCDCFLSLGFVDENRIYGAGLSMGAMGILDMTFRYPDFFAAVSPICGGVNIERARTFSGRTAFRIYHGGKDDIVLPAFSETLFSVLKESGKEAELVLFPEDNHNSWDSAFANPQFFSWLLSH